VGVEPTTRQLHVCLCAEAPVHHRHRVHRRPRPVAIDFRRRRSLRDAEV
jgi:hypothetical protein